MLKLLKKLLGFSDSGVDGLGLEIRELIKGKEIDPQKLIEMQTAINEMEAKHRTIFVAGWRPFIGWVCGIALAYNFIIRDMLGMVYGSGNSATCSTDGASYDRTYWYVRSGWYENV